RKRRNRGSRHDSASSRRGEMFCGSFGLGLPSRAPSPVGCCSHEARTKEEQTRGLGGRNALDEQNRTGVKAGERSGRRTDVAMRGRRVPGDTRPAPEGDGSIIQEDRVWNRRRPGGRGETIPIRGIRASIRVESINISCVEVEQVATAEIQGRYQRPIVSL